jgi:RNA polymerase sigma factor (sigma-70 family)
MVMSLNDDASDLAAARRGDQNAFARLYDRHGAVVLSLCRQRSLADAEDATQETFIRAYRMLDRLQAPDKFRPWLYAIAKRVCSERRRARMRRHDHEARSVMNTAVSHEPRPRPDATAEHEEQLARLDDAIGRLDETERLAIHLHYLEADPVRAAAESLGLSRSGYYKLLARARKHLAQMMSTSHENERTTARSARHAAS